MCIRDSVEDLRTRRAFVESLLQLLTFAATWRQDEEPGPMHQYYSGFDTLTADEIEEVFPEDDVPDGLHFEDIEETEVVDAFPEQQVTQWLSEGRHDCEVAQTLLHAWTRFLQGTANDSLSDFFHDLLHEAAQVSDPAPQSDKSRPQTLTLPFLASFIRQRCVLPFHVSNASSEDVEHELQQRILEEYRAIHAYVRTWQSAGAYPVDPKQHVQTELEERVQETIYPVSYTHLTLPTTPYV